MTKIDYVVLACLAWTCLMNTVTFVLVLLRR